MTTTFLGRAGILVAVFATLSGQASAQTAQRPLDEPVAAFNAASASAQRTPVDRSRISDPLWNGTLVGAGVGFASGFLGLAALNAEATASGPIWDGEALGYYTAAGLLGGGIGAAIGAIVDASRKSDRAAAVRPIDVAPILGVDRRGARVSLRF